MKLAARFRWLLIASCTCFAASCGAGSEPGTGADAPGNQLGLQASNAGGGILERIARAMNDVEFQGERRVELHATVDGQETVLEYTEFVASDGHGRFCAIPRQILAPSLSNPEQEFLVELMRGRQGFHYRFRDWQVRDVGLFQMNYSIEDLATEEVIAGRTCQRFRVRRIEAGTSEATISVDPETGVVLAFEERDLAGATVATASFTSFALAVDADQIEWYQEPFTVTAVPADGDEAAVIGFAASSPQNLPAGFRLIKTETFVLDGRRWARRVYGDGVENLLFLHGVPLAGAVSTSQTHQLNQPGQEILIRWRAIGPWTLAECRRDAGETIILMGRASKDAILEMMKSAVH